MDFDVFVVANNAIVDESIFQLWLEDYSIPEACNWLLGRGILANEDVSSWADEECVQSEVADQYRLYAVLERYMENPVRLRDQGCLQLSYDTATSLIDKYYEFDHEVIREILGKKLSAKARKDLDDVSEKTRVPLKSCRRQFDNFRRILKTVEDLKGSLVSNIQKHFLLSDTLARRYAASIFINNNRFETNKKRLNYLTFDDFLYCANQMITHWSCSSSDSKHEDMDVDVDSDYLQELRHFKLLLQREHIEELKCLACRKLDGCLTKLSPGDLETSYKNLLRVLINIAIDLNHSRELRDIFVDLVEKVVEPCRSANWSKEDVVTVLQFIQTSVRSYDIVRRHQPSLAKVWDRYMNVVNSCVIKMYHG